ncbi:MAG TPA: DUF1611 domain-containing protein [Azospirillaceae bacterium]|nr:DUF1611 domain-containing protein [Azospirillaceae bacterium]
MVDIPHPYLLFLGDSPYAKTAAGIRDWQPDKCVGQFRLPGTALDLGLPDMDLDGAVRAGARTLVIGASPPGGGLDAAWTGIFVQALERGLHIANGLHVRLNAIPELTAAATRSGCRLYDVREPGTEFRIPDFAHRPGRRVLTVGTDCAVGKKYTALALAREMRSRGMAADFRATGQTGILIAGSGLPIDAVVSDFVAAAATTLSPAAAADHWDVIEGQGSLFHPAYAGVTLGLIHGSQPDALVLCSDPTRLTLEGFPHYPQPTLAACIDLYTRVASLTNSGVRVVGISLNTARLSPVQAATCVRRCEEDLGLPCIDPLRTGVGRIVDRLQSMTAE